MCLSFFFLGSSWPGDFTSLRRLTHFLLSMAFTGYVKLALRHEYPPLDELVEYLKLACLQFHHPYIGKFEAEKNYNKLHTSSNHLNDHVLRVHYRTPQHMKDIIFTMGITDFDADRGERVRGNTHAYIQSKEDRFVTAKKVAQTALDLWEGGSGLEEVGTAKSEQMRGKKVDPTIPPMPSRPCPGAGIVSAYAVADFDSTEFGEEYVSFQKGTTILMHTALEEGWAYGTLQGGQGWFPPSFVTTC